MTIMGNISPDPWLTAIRLLDEVRANPKATYEEFIDFARELGRALASLGPPPAESMQKVQAYWIMTRPGQPLPESLFTMPPRSLLAAMKGS